MKLLADLTFVLQLELLALRKQQQEMEQFMKDERSDKDSRYRNIQALP